MINSVSNYYEAIYCLFVARSRSGCGLSANRVDRTLVPRSSPTWIITPLHAIACSLNICQFYLLVASVYCFVVVVVVNATLGSGILSPYPRLRCCRVHFGIEGSHPFACMHWQARWFVSVVGGRCRPPPSASSEHAPPPLEVLLPHSPPLSTLVKLVGTVLRGHNSPPPLCAASVLGAGMAR